MKRLIFMLMSVMLLFAVSAKAIPTDKDVGKNFKTEVIQSPVYSVETPVIVTDFNFCQRTDVQVTSDVTQLYAFTDELICHQTEKSIYNNIKQCLLSTKINGQRFSNTAYDVGKQNNISDIILPSFI